LGFIMSSVLKKSVLLKLLMCSSLLFSVSAFALDDTPDPLADELNQNPLVTEEQNFIDLTHAIDMLYSMNSDYRGLSNKSLVQSLVVSPDKVKPGYHIRNLFGGEIIVKGTTLSVTDKDGKTIINPYHAFSITYTNVPHDACKSFFGNTLKYFQSIQDNYSKPFTYDGKMKDKEYMPIIDSECKDTNTMEFIRNK
jgi:hypothetical protein